MPVALAKLGMIEARVEESREAATGEERPKELEKVITAESGGGASLLPLASLLSSTFLTSKQAFFWLLINVSYTSSPFLVFYSFSKNLLLCSCCPWH